MNPPNPPLAKGGHIIFSLPPTVKTVGYFHFTYPNSANRNHQCYLCSIINWIPAGVNPAQTGRNDKIF
jgi:hypothetical protein